MTTTYMILSLIISPLIGGGVVYYFQSRVRIREAKETADIHGAASAAQTPYQMFQQQIAAKDAQLAMHQQQSYSFVETQMARNDATTKAVLELAEQIRVQTENLKEMSSGLEVHRGDSSARSGKIYEQIGKVNERLAGLEAGVKNTLDTATEAAKTARGAVELAERVLREARTA